MYQLYKYMDKVVGVIKTNGNTQTVFEFRDPDNTDYQAYLKWLDEGGVPTPADE